MHIRIRLITYVWMLLCLLATACTSIGFELPQGPQGPDGKSAYDLWKEEVEAGRINWPGDRTTPADFFVFVKGEKGDRGADGQSAYELWKQLIAQGTVANPHDGSQTWPASKNSEADFWDFISGRDGQTPHVGSNGNWFIGATDTGVKATGRDGRDGRDGLDGKDGKDGRPGEPGKPGAEVTIIRGVPNVIAQYSQSEFGEYVRTTDGGVLYKVYDERGQLAPHAKVQGLPGIDPGKEYTSNEQGEFIVPREDLPEIQELDSRWGTTRSVTLAGKAPQESARNTYVPNRVHMRIVLENKTPSVDYQLNMTFRIQRRINPDDEWQDLPSYLPNSGSLHPETFRVADKDDPRSLIADRPVYCSNSASPSSGSYLYNCRPYRYVQENPANQKNSQKEYWDGTDVYLTVKNREAYYGEEFQWNGVALLPPYQLGPRLKSLKLKTKSGEPPTVFLSAEGELDFSHMDLTRLYKSWTRYTQRPDGSDFIEPTLYTEEEARKLKMAYVTFKFSSSAGTQEASSTNNRSSADEPTFKVLTPYLNSTIYIKYDSYHQFMGFTQGYLRPGTEEGTYRVEPCPPAYTLPEVTVTYEE